MYRLMNRLLIPASTDETTGAETFGSSRQSYEETKVLQFKVPVMWKVGTSSWQFSPDFYKCTTVYEPARMHKMK